MRPTVPPLAPSALRATPAVVLHLHLHQPPREDPWLGHVPRERELPRDHDTLARAERTCYRALVAARVVDPDGRVRRIVDVLRQASFDVSPNLLAWMARQAPATYTALLAADQASARRLGHGNAIAHPYHHTILPLLSRRDKRTEVRWGLADFARHFGRPAEGMWLPETAVDDETLDVLAEAGVRFTILAPHQLEGGPDRGHAGRYRTAAGREIALYPFDAEVAHDVAFGHLVRDGHAWAARLRGRLDDHARPADAPDAPAPVVAIAATAETFGMNHKRGDRALAAMLDALDHPGLGPDGRVRGIVPTVNFAALLAATPAASEVRIVERTSWSCPHALGRWREACGCRRDAATQQAWRAPLAAALAELRDALNERFAAEGGHLFGHLPGGADAVRDAYNDALPNATGKGDSLALVGGLVPESHDPVWARELLDMAREGLATTDADGIGADDLADAPAQAMLAHAARAALLAGSYANRVTDRLRRALSLVAGAHAAAGTARTILQRLHPTDPPLTVRIAAGVAAAAAVGARGGTPPAWRVETETPVLRVADRRLDVPATYAVVVDVPTLGLRPDQPPRLSDVDPRGITIVVRPVAGAPGARPAFADSLGAALKLGDLPEPARVCVELALRRAVVLRLLDLEDRERLAAGEGKLRVLAGAALVRAIQGLGGSLAALDSAGDGFGPRGPIATVSAPLVARVLGLADLAESAGAGTPFDAQTALYRLGCTLSPAARDQLAPIAWRLGFSARGWREIGDPEADGGA